MLAALWLDPVCDGSFVKTSPPFSDEGALCSSGDRVLFDVFSGVLITWVRAALNPTFSI